MATQPRFKPLGYVKNTLSASAVSLSTVPSGANRVILTNDSSSSNSVYWRDDGGTPAAGTGDEIPAGSKFTYVGDPTVIKVFATSATLHTTFYA